MKLPTEEFLYEVLWMADTILNPTWNNLLDNFETWAAREGLLRRLHELEHRRFLEHSPSATTPAADCAGICGPDISATSRTVFGYRPIP
ncbi:MAG: hypothetical protein KJ072_26925 [Verrucomicrobia bacterium]|nr:hypothetical protein [Verrucomicrobiota bacterium]